MASASLDPELLLAMRCAARAEAERQLREEGRLAAALRERLMSRLRPVIDDLRSSGLLRGAWIFGSYAWGTPTEASDVDLLIESDRDALYIATEVSRAIGLDVHALARDSAPTTLLARISAEGIAL